ncbi:beta-lactamase [Russula earlei]|uniref:Beta-lactamase n=1 Tax=Russula earlei TaxID=71964 RepID=A0ACC0TXX6_9AGAM|nr:beta-lactamase [Russula earlei]
MIYKDGNVIYRKEIGTDFKANVQAPITGVCQWLTAALVMTFVDQGKLSLDDNVGQYLPVFNTYGKKFVTIRTCLAHMTGIDADQGVMKQTLNYETLEAAVNAFAGKHEIKNNPGVEFRYTQVGLDIAARVCEVVGKRGYEQLMNERILRPLNMHNTSFFATKAVNPSGGAISTAADLTNFVAMILNKGVFNGKRILSEKAIADMQTPQTNSNIIKYAPKGAEGLNYGLGEWVQVLSLQDTLVSGPNFEGVFPFVDNCRGYACVFFVKEPLGESRKEIYADIKKIIDSIIPSNNCD